MCKQANQTHIHFLMASIVSQTIVCLCLLFFSQIASSMANKEEHVHYTNPSPFEFLKTLQGRRKGDKINKLRFNQLKNYLNRYGYLENSDHNSKSHSLPDNNGDDMLDDILESAIKTFQMNHNLNVTGFLDPHTISKMVMPRCGSPDIISRRSRMRAANKEHTNVIHIGSRYSFFQGYPRWYKTQLSYGFNRNFPQYFKDAMASAFQRWARVINFSFYEISDYQTADLKISFERGYHGDDMPFDGPFGQLGHAYSPRSGLCHFDADETWVQGAEFNAVDFESVALHEIGHLLGLMHSSDESAIMYPTIPVGAIKRELTADDIEGIRVLYYGR